MNKNFAKPMSIASIRNISIFVRKILNVPDDKPVNVVKALDILTIKLFKYNFNYIVLEDSDTIFKEDEEAKTNIINETIYIKRSVYEEASHKKYCRAHFTISHEIGHFILHRMLNGINLARSKTNYNLMIYENPEWQADVFASELLMPYEQCLNLSADKIRKQYHVSTGAANTRYEKINKKVKIPASTSTY
jgi:Zn-dependent peptidase ImmA (M78 family)